MMQNSSTLSSAVAIPAKTAVAVKAAAGARLAYIDTIRMILTILVIMVHAACTYGAFGDWTYIDRKVAGDELTGVLLSLFLFVCQSFFMGLFFFYAGVFTPASYDRKGTLRFWKDRLLRLGLPMLAYTYLLSRVPNYINAYDNNGLRMPFWEFARSTFWTNADAGPTWFLFALLVFSLAYTIVRLAARALRLDLSWASRVKAPGIKTLLAAGLGISIAMFAVAQVEPLGQMYHALNAYNLALAFFPAYILLFTVGLIAGRSDWLAQINAKMLRFWGWLSLALIVLLPTFLILGGAIDEGMDPFLTGLNWGCALTCLWFGTASITFSTTLSLWARNRGMRQESGLMKATALAGPNTFTVYLIHPLVLVPITYAMSFMAIPAMAKFFIASLATVAACYALAAPLRRIPGAKAVL